MGTVLPPNEDGVACGFCWGPGKTFGDTATPRYMGVQMSGLLPGEHWRWANEQLLLTPHFLVQTVAPCQYQIYAAPYQWLLDFRIATTVAMVIHAPSGKFVFRGSDAWPCSTLVFSDFENGIDRLTYSGKMRIFYNEEGLTF